MGQFAARSTAWPTRATRSACPIVSGNVSLYNETDGQRDPADADGRGRRQLAHAEDVVHRAFAPGARSRCSATARGALGGSEWLTSQGRRRHGRPAGIDLAAEARLQKLLLVSLARKRVLGERARRERRRHRGVPSPSAASRAASAARSELGLHAGRELAKLWSEEPSRVVVSYAPEYEALVRGEAEAAGVPFAVIGTTGGPDLVIDQVVRVPVTALAKAHREALDKVVG